MRKKSGLTIVEQAIVLVPEFEKVAGKLEQQVTLRGQINSILQNYIRRIALFVAHCSFKHKFYGRRYYFRLPGNICPQASQSNEIIPLLLKNTPKKKSERTKACNASKNSFPLNFTKPQKTPVSTQRITGRCSSTPTHSRALQATQGHFY